MGKCKCCGRPCYREDGDDNNLCKCCREPADEKYYPQRSVNRDSIHEVNGNEPDFEIYID